MNLLVKGAASEHQRSNETLSKAEVVPISELQTHNAGLTRCQFLDARTVRLNAADLQAHCFKY